MLCNTRSYGNYREKVEIYGTVMTRKAIRNYVWMASRVGVCTMHRHIIIAVFLLCIQNSTVWSKW